MMKIIRGLVVVTLLFCIAGTSMADGTWTVIPNAPEGNTRAEIDIDIHGNLWLAHKTYVYRFDGETWEKIELEQQLYNSGVMDVSVSVDNSVWVMTSRELQRYDGSKWEVHPYKLSETYFNNEYDFKVGGIDNVWCGTHGAVLSYRGGIWEEYDDTHGLPQHDIHVRSLAVNDNNNVCVSFSYPEYDKSYTVDGETRTPLGKATYYYDGDVWHPTKLNYISHLRNPSLAFDYIAVSPDGDFWCTSEWTIWKLNEYVWDPVYKGEYLGLKGMDIDTSGNIWVSTANGVAFYDGEKLTEYTRADGLPGGKVKTLAAGINGEVWVVTEEGLAKYTPDETFVETSMPSGFSISEAFPNPFNGSTMITYTIPYDMPISVSVYNCMGQNIRSLDSGNAAAGTHTAVWNGKSGDGTAASSGVYFIRLETGNIKLTKKVTFVQ